MPPLNKALKLWDLLGSVFKKSVAISAGRDNYISDSFRARASRNGSYRASAAADGAINRAVPDVNASGGAHLDFNPLTFSNNGDFFAAGLPDFAAAGDYISTPAIPAGDTYNGADTLAAHISGKYTGATTDDTSVSGGLHTTNQLSSNISGVYLSFNHINSAYRGADTPISAANTPLPVSNGTIFADGGEHNAPFAATSATGGEIYNYTAANNGSSGDFVRYSSYGAGDGTSAVPFSPALAADSTAARTCFTYSAAQPLSSPSPDSPSENRFTIAALSGAAQVYHDAAPLSQTAAAVYHSSLLAAPGITNAQYSQQLQEVERVLPVQNPLVARETQKKPRTPSMNIDAAHYDANTAGLQSFLNTADLSGLNGFPSSASFSAMSDFTDAPGHSAAINSLNTHDLPDGTMDLFDGFYAQQSDHAGVVTLAPQVVLNIENINENADIDCIIDKITRRLEDELAAGAEGIFA